MKDDSRKRDAARPTGRTASRFRVASFSVLTGLLVALCGVVMAQTPPGPPAYGSGIVRVPPPPDGPSRMAYAHGEAVRANLRRRGFGYADPRASATVRSIAASAGGRWSTQPGTKRMIQLLVRRHPIAAGVQVTSTMALLYVAGSYVVNMVAEPDPQNFTPIVVGSTAWGVNGVYLYPTKEAAVLGHVDRQYNFLRVKTLAWGEPQPAGGTNPWHPFVYPVGVTVVQSETTNPTTGEIVENTQYLGVMTVRAYEALISCGTGQMIYTSGSTRSCLATNVSPGLYQPAPQTYEDLEAWLNAHVNQNANQALHPEFIAETANQLWRDAAADPSYSGVPYSAANRVTAADVAPDAIPSLGALNEPVTLPASAVIDPYENPDAITNPPTPEDAQHVIVDFGDDPGIAEPILEEPPTGVMDPLLDALAPLFDFDVQMAPEECPTWNDSVSVAGYSFNINLVEHCALIDPWYSFIYSLSASLWMVGAVFVVLRA